MLYTKQIWSIWYNQNVLVCEEIVKKISIKIVYKVFSLHPFKYTRPMNGLNKWFSEDIIGCCLPFFLEESFFKWIVSLIDSMTHPERQSHVSILWRNWTLFEPICLWIRLVQWRNCFRSNHLTEWFNDLPCNLQESFFNKSVSNRIGLVFWRNHFNKLVHWMIRWVIWMTHKDATGVTISVWVNLSPTWIWFIIIRPCSV